MYVPLGSVSSYNDAALAVYQEAMPGYTIVGVNSSETGWKNTDALHCRTRGVMDFNMLFVDHRDVVYGKQAWQDSIAITSKFIAYSGRDLKKDSLLVYYSIDGGEYQVAPMTATGNADEYVGYIKGYQSLSSVNYYVFGADESGHRYTQPVFAELEPHHFTMEVHEPATIHDIRNKVTEDGSVNSEVTVFDSTGRKVLFVRDSNEIDIQSLTAGLYLVKVTGANGNSTVKKIIKK